MREQETFKPNELTITDAKNKSLPMIEFCVRTHNKQFDANFSPWQGDSSVGGETPAWKQAATLFQEHLEKHLTDDREIKRAFKAFRLWELDRANKGVSGLEDLLRPNGLENFELIQEEKAIQKEIDALELSLKGLYKKKEELGKKQHRI